MGLFNFFKNPEKEKNSNIDLAEGLFSTLYLSTGSIYEKNKKQIETILKRCSTRQDILNKVIQLCGKPDTPRQRYLLAKAYSWSNVKYRKLAIKHLELYLNNTIYEGAYSASHHMLGNMQFTLKDERNIHLSVMYSALGKAYEGEYEFDKALTCYNNEQALTPFWPAPFCHICSILVKQNKMKDAMEVYLGAKKSQYYKPIKFKNLLGEPYKEDTYKKVIDAQIVELQGKIDKGYVYKPRKNTESDIKY